MDAQDALENRPIEWKDTQGSLPGAAARAIRRRRRLGAGRPSWTRHPVTLLVAVVVSVALLWAVGASVVHWRARVAAERLQQIEQEAARQAQLRAQQLQREAADREAQRQALLDQQAAAKAQAIAERQRLDDEARRTEADAADRKEKAWSKFYRPSAYCETAATMECVNGRIRARRSFEQKWNKGEF
jgi:flagellar biosynthesis GTPase FlhF